MRNPEILPQEYQLATLVDENYVALKNKLINQFNSFQTFTYLDEETADSPGLVRHFTRLSIAFNGITDDASSVYAYKAISEAFYFANRLGASLPGEYTPEIAAYYNCFPEELRQKISNDAIEYLLDRPKIAELIKYFSYDISEDSAHRWVAELVAAVTLMHLEEGTRQKYIAEQLGYFAAELSCLPVDFYNSLEEDAE